MEQKTCGTCAHYYATGPGRGVCRGWLYGAEMRDDDRPAWCRTYSPRARTATGTTEDTLATQDAARERREEDR